MDEEDVDSFLDEWDKEFIPLLEPIPYIAPAMIVRDLPTPIGGTVTLTVPFEEKYPFRKLPEFDWGFYGDVPTEFESSPNLDSLANTDELLEKSRKFFEEPARWGLYDRTFLPTTGKRYQHPKKIRKSCSEELTVPEVAVQTTLPPLPDPIEPSEPEQLNLFD